MTCCVGVTARGLLCHHVSSLAIGRLARGITTEGFEGVPGSCTASGVVIVSLSHGRRRHLSTEGLSLGSKCSMLPTVDRAPQRSI